MSSDPNSINDVNSNASHIPLPSFVLLGMFLNTMLREGQIDPSEALQHVAWNMIIMAVTLPMAQLMTFLV